MKKLLNPRELIASAIQLMIFGLLIPCFSVLLGMMLDADPVAKERFASSFLSLLPYSDAIQNVFIGIDVTGSGMANLYYASATLSTIGDNVVAAMYLGMWIYAFRVLFGEIIPVRGLPILQIASGLLMGALTFTVIDDGLIMSLLATLFLFALNIVLTIFANKAVWKKIIEVFFNISMQSILAAVSIAYFAALAACFQGLYANITQAVTTIVVTTLLWILWIFVQYLVVGK